MDRTTSASHSEDMTMTFDDIREGDVLRYAPARTWCREGLAIVERVRNGGLIAFDTYWITGRTVLLSDDLATAEVLFNLNDVERFEPSPDASFADFDLADQFVITHQHGLQREQFIRRGAKPSPFVKVLNARRVLAEAQAAGESAQFRIGVARRDLAIVEAAYAASQEATDVR